MSLVRHEPCPKCRAKGEDKKGNNLARYSDGSAWCFAGHKLVERANRIPVIDDKWLQKEKDGFNFDGTLLSTDYPLHIVEWLDKYGITVPEALKHGWKYNKKYDQLVFIFKDQYGNVSCTQARNFAGAAKRKYFNEGDANSTLPIFQCGTERTNSVVITEDVVSSAKVGRQVDAMPCLGSYLSKQKLNALRLLGYKHIIFWLDADKLAESMKMSDQAKWLGFTTQVVHTPLDPKEYSDEEICCTLTVG